jgi:RND family efflux transporter MFP subunit
MLIHLFRARFGPCLLALVTLAASHGPRAAADDKQRTAVRPALSVNVVQPQRTPLTLRLNANGNIAAWQEASVGTEANGLRLAEVKVNVGDVVKRGQLLASFAPEMLQAELDQTGAAAAEAEAVLAEATANAQRARELQPTGVLSAQQTNQILTAERTAQARLEAQRAAIKVQQLRLRQTQVLAPDDGIISARNATVGAVIPAGQELFRLIRQGRLEWRGEVSATQIARLRPGMAVTVAPANLPPVQGRVRVVAPTVDPQTRNGLVYVDLPAPGGARLGMFAAGEIDLGSTPGLTLPQGAVQLRDGFSTVMRVGADSKVTLTKVGTGRRIADRIEITSGLDGSERVVAAGGAFLGDGDVVRVVDGATPAAPPGRSAAPAK